MTKDDRRQELLTRLRGGLIIKDGAMGTTLSAAGHSGQSLELLNVEQPDRVTAVHAAYAAAGSEMVETNTFQGNGVALARHGLAERAVELNQAAAALAREAVGDRVFVAGSIGPTGGILEPYGDLDPGLARAAFQEQAAALAEGGVDLLVVETFSALEEVLLALAAALATGLPVVASMAFDPNGRTAFGVSPAKAAEQLEAAGATVVGANCGTVSPAEMVGVIRQLRQATALPLMAQPNAGRPVRTESGTSFPEGPEALADAAPGFRDAGASLIGGCCGTTPEHIRAVVARLTRPLKP
jgi:methionine synthase I (cobalamin-dependent)